MRGINFGGPIVKSGIKIVCTKCMQPIAVVNTDLKYGDNLNPEKFDAVHPQKIGLGQMTISHCHGVAWYDSGCLSTEIGWLPWNPHHKNKKAVREGDSSLIKKRTFI